MENTIVEVKFNNEPPTKGEQFSKGYYLELEDGVLKLKYNDGSKKSITENVLITIGLINWINQSKI